MMWTTVTLLTLSVYAVALPVLQVRQSSGSWCANLGGGAFDTARNFTLSAFNATTPDSGGAQLVLGQAGSTEGKEFGVLSTFASYPYNQFPSFSLNSGALLPNYEESGMYSSDLSVAAGSPPTFEYSTQSQDLDPSAQIYCAVADTDPNGGSMYPMLAVNEQTDGFSLCLTGDGANAQNNVVFQPTADNNGEYVYSSCYPVFVRLLGLD
ncbi:hypothetical protein BKA93DRAFT_829460 [Sparassis latifolia]|uniref:Uncharacterized protein n=1 Tax=Sparassis crispa TaxID=139825 RepID=A0A401G9S7_9APHY|nr:hypothetical protein SCP_0201170 [Sparassis crispa]GBE78920.1 hypothetical protein SCP_0201170 [Sparassis crispa]